MTHIIATVTWSDARATSSRCSQISASRATLASSVIQKYPRAWSKRRYIRSRYCSDDCVNSVSVRLPLLTITNPNQMREVLLFVRFNMANLSAKLSVADNTREIGERKLCWWCLSHGFPLSTFLLGFAVYFCFIFTSTPYYDSVCMLKSLREDLSVSLYRFFWPPWERFLLVVFHREFFIDKPSSGILVTWPVRLNCANVSRIYTLCIAALFRTSVSEWNPVSPLDL